MAEKAYVNADVLSWARVSARISLEDAAAKISISVERLTEWESGDSQPTIRQAEKLAKMYRRPFALLFLPEIPDDFQPLQDFRRRGSEPLGTASTFIIREMQQKQAWLSDEFKANGEQQNGFIGRFSLNDDPAKVARDILSTIQIDPEHYVGTSPLRHWIDKAEAAGIFVSRTSFIHSRMKLDCEEFQGFAISDPFAPFVFLNSDDWDSPLLFTLVHELAHLWIGESGISNLPEQDIDSFSGFSSVELFCNEVAANALMPVKLMQTFSLSIFSSAKEVFRNIRGLGVSTYAFLVRAYKLKIINLDTYRNLKIQADREFVAFRKREEAKKTLQRASETSGGPSYYLLQVNKNGRLFTQIVLDAYKGGIIEPTQASLLLNVKVNNFQGLEAQLYS
jgi:Zn-dependent peptidase ImmA (M78 family)/DNA-binding XRE family transcriptional regulator